jgi:broad specificity phosphatase PhoE
MRLILIRHYRTEFNVSGHIMGWGDSPQATGWAEDLGYIARILEQRGAVPAVIYSSDLRRSRQTAAFFAEHFGLHAATATTLLNEVNYGELHRKRKSWVAAHYTQHKTDPAFVYPGGESFNEMQQRSVDFIDRIAAAAEQNTVLCVTHSGVIRGLLSHYLGLAFAAQLRRRISHRYIGVLEFDGGRCTRYEEWGAPSSFANEGFVQLPPSRG